MKNIFNIFAQPTNQPTNHSRMAAQSTFFRDHVQALLGRLEAILLHHRGISKDPLQELLVLEKAILTWRLAKKRVEWFSWFFPAVESPKKKLFVLWKKNKESKKSGCFKSHFSDVGWVFRNSSTYGKHQIPTELLIKLISTNMALIKRTSTSCIPPQKVKRLYAGWYWFGSLNIGTIMVNIQLKTFK